MSRQSHYKVRHNACRTGTIASHHETPMIPGFVAMPTVAMPVPKTDITHSMLVSNSLDYGLFYYYLLVASCYTLTCEFSVFNFCIKFPFIGRCIYACVCVLFYTVLFRFHLVVCPSKSSSSISKLSLNGVFLRAVFLLAHRCFPSSSSSFYTLILLCFDMLLLLLFC